VYGSTAGENWYGLGCVRQLAGLPPELLMVPLPGHTFGHAGVAVLRDDGQWLLQTGDAYFYHREMALNRPSCTPGLRFYQAMMEKDRGARLANQHRLRELKRRHGAAVEIFCAHDPLEYERLSGRAMGEPCSDQARSAAAGFPQASG
jgi:glyoxylase-like metal-dependent hydrolase (beta-lactamase superfamily II)